MILSKFISTENSARKEMGNGIKIFSSEISYYCNSKTNKSHTNVFHLISYEIIFAHICGVINKECFQTNC